MTNKKRPKRAAVSKELVPVRDPLWDSQVQDILSQVHWYTSSSQHAAPEVRRMLNIHAVGRLESLVADMETRLGYTPK